MLPNTVLTDKTPEKKYIVTLSSFMYGLRSMVVIPASQIRGLLSFIVGTLVLQFAILSFSLSMKSEPIGISSESSLSPEFLSFSGSSPIQPPLSVMPEPLQSVATGLGTSTINKDLTFDAQNQNEMDPFLAEFGDGASLISHTITSGDTLSVIWRQYDAPVAGALRAAQALKGVGLSVRQLKIGHVIDLVKSRSGDIVGFRKTIDGGRTLFLKGSSETGYTGHIETPKIKVETRTVLGTINSSFASSVYESSVPYTVVDELVDLFGTRLDFRRDFQPGDQYVVRYAEHKIETGEVVKVGDIEAASLKLGEKVFSVIRYVGSDGKARFFDEAGKLIGDYFLRYPVQFTRVSSVFSDSRLHPVLGRRRAHNGVDFAAPIGTPVRAASDGRVVVFGFKGGSGNMIKVQHGGRYATTYLHLSKFATGVRQGTQVKRGQVIGYVGQTGLATGPHLHFGLYDNGRYVDPLKAPLPAIDLNKDQMISPQYLQAAVKELDRFHKMQEFASTEKIKAIS